MAGVLICALTQGYQEQILAAQGYSQSILGILGRGEVGCVGVEANNCCVGFEGADLWMQVH
jgi:hypothetical protein